MESVEVVERAPIDLAQDEQNGEVFLLRLSEFQPLVHFSKGGEEDRIAVADSELSRGFRGDEGLGGRFDGKGRLPLKLSFMELLESTGEVIDPLAPVGEWGAILRDKVDDGDLDVRCVKLSIPRSSSGCCERTDRRGDAEDRERHPEKVEAEIGSRLEHRSLQGSRWIGDR